MSGFESEGNHITAEEIEELNLDQNRKTMNLKQKMKNATFYGFKDLQNLEDSLNQTKQ